MEEYREGIGEELTQMHKMKLYIDTHPEVYGFFRDLVIGGSRKNFELCRFEDSIATVQETERELLESLERIQELQKELESMGIELMSLKTFAPKGYVPVLSSKSSSSYGKYDYLENDEYLTCFGQKMKNPARMEFPALVKTEEGNITLAEMEEEDKNQTISKAGEKWFSENKELAEELIALEKEIQQLERQLSAHKKRKFPFDSNRVNLIEEKLAAKKRIFDKKNQEAKMGYFLVAVLSCYRSLTPQQKSVIRQYAGELVRFDYLTRKIETQVKKTMQIEAELFATTEQSEVYVETALEKGIMTQEQIDQMDEFLINMDLSSVDTSGQEIVDSSPRGKMTDMLIISYCYGRILAKRAKKQR